MRTRLKLLENMANSNDADNDFFVHLFHSSIVLPEWDMKREGLHVQSMKN